MKLGIHNDVDWAYVGAWLAREDDIHQVEFFKAFVKEANTWGTHFQVESQFAMINQKLTPEEREQLSMITYDG